MTKWILVFTAAALVCLTLLVSISFPVKQVTSQIPFSLEDGTAGEITLATPAYLRLGDWTDLEMEITFNQITSAEESVQVKANLESIFLEVKPDGEVMAVIPVNGKGPFKWQVRSNSAGEQSASAWCFRQDSDRQTLIFAREFTFEVKSVLGIRYNLARWMLGGLTFLFAILLAINIKREKNRIQYP